MLAILRSNRLFTKEFGAVLIFLAWISQNYFESNYRDKMEALNEKRQYSFHYKELISDHRMLFFTEKESSNSNVDKLKKIYNITIELQNQSLKKDFETLNKSDEFIKKEKEIQRELVQLMNIDCVREFTIKADDLYNSLKQESAENAKEIGNEYEKVRKAKQSSNRNFLWASILGFLLYSFNHVIGLVERYRKTYNNQSE